MIILQQEIYLYLQNYQKLIAIDLSRQTNKNIPQNLISQDNWKKMMVRQCFLSQKNSKEQL